MEKEFKAKTVEEAKALAAADFGVSTDDIDFEILEQPKKGLFGGLKGEARVKAIYNQSLESAGDSDSDAQTTTSVASDDYADYDVNEEPVGEIPEDFDVNESVKVKTAIEFLTKVIRGLGVENFTITPKISEKGKNNIILDISGEKLGAVIGKRGETLDSLQYLAILASARKSEESFCRISLDCNSYRSKRRETLENLAKKTSAKVIKQGRKISLDPMNPYERRIIHSCVAEIEGVTSRSSGTEPYRRVVIYADKPKYDNRRRGGNRDSRRGNRDGASTRNYRSSGGFSTSFEREYKRSQYQPDENANAGDFSDETVEAERNATLYGKIDI